MAAIDIAIISLLAICVVIGLGEPFIRRDFYRSFVPIHDGARERILLQKEMAYGAIRDLDFDFQTGKVDQKDYAELRQQLEREAVQILRQLDALDPQWMFENAVEQHVLTFRHRGASPTYADASSCCPGCGTFPEHAGQFCAFCGQTLRRP